MNQQTRDNIIGYLLTAVLIAVLVLTNYAVSII